MATKEVAGLGEIMEGAPEQPLHGVRAGTDYDRVDMSRMGKMQEFRRNFSFIPIFGFTMVLMISWEAVLAAASWVLPNGGPTALVWTFLYSVLGFGAAILSMAEMASWAPTAGGQYHWVSEFAPPGVQKILSYVVGWGCVLGWQAGIAGQSFGAGLQIQGLIYLNDPTYIPKAWHSTLLGIAIAMLGCLFNTFLARKLPLIETLMLVIHIVGFPAILIPLWVMAPKTPSQQVWNELQNNAGWSSSGLAFMVGVTSSVNALIGPDSAVHMAEEVRDASRVLPRAMVLTLIVNGTAGFVMAITFAYCLGPLDEAIKPPYFFAFIGTFYTATGSHAGATVMSCIIALMTTCSAITNVATGSRQMYAFARDNGLPFSGFLSYVRYDIPLNAILVSFTIAALASLINLGSSVAYNAILSIGVAALLGSYVISISCIVWRRLSKQPLTRARWSLGVWGLPLNLIGLAYLAIAWVFAFFPLGTPVTIETMNWASAAYGGMVIVATVYYLLFAHQTYVAPIARVTKEL